MTPWLLSIVGITVLGVLIELLLTDSPMSKFVRSIYGFFILFVIVQPIPGFIRDASTAVGGGVTIDNDLLQTINNNSALAFARNAENALSTAGMPGLLVTIEHDRNSPSFKINRIFVNAWGSTNIDTDLVIRIVATVCNVPQDVIQVFV